VFVLYQRLFISVRLLRILDARGLPRAARLQQQEDAEGAGDQRGGDGGGAAVRDVRSDADVRGVGQPGSQTPEPGGQSADVPALARGRRPAAGVAAGAQLRLVDGRGAQGRVRGGPS